MTHIVLVPPKSNIPARAAARAVYRPLGAFRFALALMVVGQHFQHLLPMEERAIFHRLGFGAIAVAVFFVISGFVVAEANIVFYLDRVLAFLINRVLRLVPAYLAALAISVCVHGVLWHMGVLVLWDFALVESPLSPQLIVSNVLGILPGFHPRYIGPNFEFIPFIWTLRLEMGFYVAAAIVLATSKSRPWFTGGALGLGICAGYLSLVQQRPCLLNDVPLFISGTLCYFAITKPRTGRWLAFASAYLAGVLGLQLKHQYGSGGGLWQVVLLSALLLVFVWLVSARTTISVRRVDRFLGDLSYPLYLNHYVIGIALFDIWSRRGLFAYAVAVALSLAFAWIMGAIVDEPLRHLRSKLRGQRL
jgi:peptidoglycan/LPS O-acetylase OafA/YrhL